METEQMVTLAMIAEEVQAVTGLKNLAARATVGDTWITWDQIGSRQTMANAIAVLKAAGHPGFFSNTDRRWGIKIPENFAG